MKRYFDIEKDKLTLEIGVNMVSNSYTIEEIEESLGFGGLREVDRVEFNTLTKIYTGEGDDNE